MKTITFTFIILLYGSLVTIPKHFSIMKTIEKNGMTVSWQFRGDQIEIEVFAPTQGWVAIGFNESDQLKGTNLIMGNVKANHTKVSDRYIVDFGDHRSIETLNGINHLSEIKGEESKKGTTLQFNVCRKAKDKYHFDLVKDNSINLLLAYSQADDFDHHSIMRTSIKIKL